MITSVKNSTENYYQQVQRIPEDEPRQWKQKKKTAEKLSRQWWKNESEMLRETESN